MKQFASITGPQKRALSVVTGILLLLSAWFLQSFLITIIAAGILAFLFAPLYDRLRMRMGSGWAATTTFLAMAASIILPLAAVLSVAVVQVSGLVNSAISYFQHTDLQKLGSSALTTVNDTLASLPFATTQLSQDDLKQRLTEAAQAVGHWLPGFLSSSASSFFELFTLLIIFIYVFFSLITKQSQVISTFKHLNPLGDEISDMYLRKTGAMVKATIRGQFIIALLQGLAGAVSLQLAGFHQGFFVLLILFTLLALIPPGSGVLAIPFGLGLMAFGNISGGILVILFHILVTTNIDNVMRPVLVPKEAQLDSALLMLAVFAGIAMFGLIGIVIGPVFMILVTTTVEVYRAVNYGIPMDNADTKTPAKHRLRDNLKRLRAKLPV